MASWLEKPIRGVLLDITGVLKDGKVAIDGSVEAFKKLRNSKLPVRLVTNETQVARKYLHEELNTLGFAVNPNDIIAPAPALVRLLQKSNLRPHLLVHQKLVPEFDGIETSNPNCLVIGDAAEYFTYNSMNEAFLFLLNAPVETKFFTLGRGKYYKENGELMLDVGAFTVALEYATGRKAELVGKPSEAFFQSALDELGLSKDEVREQVVMIGDDILGDVGGAQKSGLRGVLVRTGKYRPEIDENHPEVKPDGIVDNLSQAIDLILKQ